MRNFLALAAWATFFVAGCTFNIINPEIKDNTIGVNLGQNQDQAWSLSGAWTFIQAADRYDVSLTHHPDGRLTGIASQDAKRVGTMEGRVDGLKVNLTFEKDDATVLALNGSYDPESDQFGGSDFLAIRK